MLKWIKTVDKDRLENALFEGFFTFAFIALILVQIFMIGVVLAKAPLIVSTVLISLGIAIVYRYKHPMWSK